jgi:hypothetical protein
VADYDFIIYETLDDGRIARILLDRPEARNAQNRGMLVELNEAFLRAEADDDHDLRRHQRGAAEPHRPAGPRPAALMVEVAGERVPW